MRAHERRARRDFEDAVRLDREPHRLRQMRVIEEWTLGRHIERVVRLDELGRDPRTGMVRGRRIA